METTADSLKGAEEDVDKRATEVAEKEKKEKEQTRDAMSTPETQAKKAAGDKTTDADSDKPPERKPPTLYRKGEKKEGGGQ